MCGTSPVNDDKSYKSIDDDKLHLDHRDRSFSTVAVNNGHSIVTEIGKFKKYPLFNEHVN